MNFRGRKMLVTGGTGFIGGRLVEKLVLECKAQVRVFLRNTRRSERLAHLPVEFVYGDLNEESAVSRAVAGCDIVFHCAFGNSGSRVDAELITVQGTERMARAALAAHVSRFVHVSTFAVYGNVGRKILDETAPRQKTQTIYADSKLEAEQIVFNYYQHKGLPVTVIQPTIVYGPHGGSWTEWPINQLKSSRVVLIDGGVGLCNSVYVDDVVDAMILSAVNRAAIGEAFLISSEHPVIWRDFFGAYEKILGFKSTVSMTSEEVRRYFKKREMSLNVLKRVVALSKQIYNRVKKIAPTEETGSTDSLMKPLWVPPVELFGLFNSRTTVSIAKAREKIGYCPRFDFGLGMSLTASWAQDGGIVRPKVTATD